MTLSGLLRLTLCSGLIMPAIILMTACDSKAVWFLIVCRMAYCFEVRL